MPFLYSKTSIAQFWQISFADGTFTPRTVENGRLTEVIIHILDEEELSARKADSAGEEASV